MSNQISDYFCVLLKQQAGLSGNEAAAHTARQIADSLYAVLDNDSCARVESLLPEYLQRGNKQFWLKLSVSNRQYSHASLIERLMLLQGLTDKSEVEHRLRAFLRTTQIVGGQVRYAKLVAVLPIELQALALPKSV